MLNKNDPLIGAVQEVMKKNQAEREAAKLVNEKFGVTDRKAMPHERQHEWDAAYKSVLSEGLHPNQQKLDVHEPEKDKLTSQDFKMLRAKKKSVEEENVPKTDPYAEGQASSISVVSQPKKEITSADQSALKKKIQSIKEANLQEKAVSKAQQRFMGLVRGIQKGKAHGSAKAEKAAETMSAKEVKKYAGTKQKGLPEKVTEAMVGTQIKSQTQYGGSAPTVAGGKTDFAGRSPTVAGGKTDFGGARPARPAIDSAPRPQQASPMMGQGSPGIKKSPGGARPSVVAKNAPTGSQSSTGMQVGGARPGLVAKNTPTAPKKITPTGNPNMAGSGGSVKAKVTPTGNPNMAGSGGNVKAKPAASSATATKPVAKSTKPVVKAVRKATPTAPAKPKASPLQKQMARSKTGRDSAVVGPGGRMG